MNNTALLLFLLMVPACDCGTGVHDAPTGGGPVITMPPADDAGSEDAGDDGVSPAERELHELLQMRPVRFPLPRGAQNAPERKVVGC